MHVVDVRRQLTLIQTHAHTHSFALFLCHSHSIITHSESILVVVMNLLDWTCTLLIVLVKHSKRRYYIVHTSILLRTRKMKI